MTREPTLTKRTQAGIEQQRAYQRLKRAATTAVCAWAADLIVEDKMHAPRTSDAIKRLRRCLERLPK